MEGKQSIAIIKGLLTPKQLEQAAEPLNKSYTKKRFLKALLKHRLQVISALEETKVRPEELLVWREEDEAFREACMHYDKLIIEELAANAQYSAVGCDDLKMKVAVLSLFRSRLVDKVRRRFDDEFDMGSLESEIPATVRKPSKITISDPVADMTTKESEDSSMKEQD